MKKKRQKMSLQRETLREDLQRIYGGRPDDTNVEIKESQPLSSGPSWCGC